MSTVWRAVLGSVLAALVIGIPSLMYSQQQEKDRQQSEALSVCQKQIQELAVEKPGYDTIQRMLQTQEVVNARQWEAFQETQKVIDRLHPRQ